MRKLILLAMVTIMALFTSCAHRVADAPKPIIAARYIAYPDPDGKHFYIFVQNEQDFDAARQDICKYRLCTLGVAGIVYTIERLK